MANVVVVAKHRLSLSLFYLWACLTGVLGQGLPVNDCSSMFQYQRSGGKWIGVVTVPTPFLQEFTWSLRFSSHGNEQTGSISSLMTYPDKETVFQRAHNRLTIQLSVQFDNYRYELPKLVRIARDNELFCRASEYDPPSRTSNRQLKISLSSASQQPYLVIQQRPSNSQSASTVSFEHRWSNNPFLKQTTGSTTTSTTTTTTTTTRRPTLVTVDNRYDPSAAECGVEGFTGLQFGGENVPRGRFPWLSALYHDASTDPIRIDLVYKCVSTLISGRTLITAAHCVFSKTAAQLRVYVGRHDVTKHPEKDATLMAVEKVIMHPDFEGNLVPDSDIALLVLTEHVQYSNYVRPICLWSSGASLSNSDQITVAGWGIDATLKPTRFPTSVNVQPVTREECLREMITAKDFLTPRTICAGNSEGHGPCLGDSGGGMMVYRNNRWSVRGIISIAQRSGNGCDLSRYVIYCDVASHLRWVESNIVR